MDISEKIIDFEVGGLYKFVEVDGQFRWTVGMGNHFELVTEDEYSKIQSAGTVSILCGSWKVVDTYSSSLVTRGVKAAFVNDGTVNKLKKILGDNYKSEY